MQINSFYYRVADVIVHQRQVRLRQMTRYDEIKNIVAIILGTIFALPVYAAVRTTSVVTNTCMHTSTSAYLPSLLSQVTATSTGVSAYSYLLCNDSFTASNTADGTTPTNDTDFSKGSSDYLLRSFAVPLLDDVATRDIKLPDGWKSEIVAVGTASTTTGWDGGATCRASTEPSTTSLNSAYGSSTKNPYTNAKKYLHFYTGTFTKWQATDNFDLAYTPSGFEMKPHSYENAFYFSPAYKDKNYPYQTAWVRLAASGGKYHAQVVCPQAPGVHVDNTH